jgi:hypothetical protein
VPHRHVAGDRHRRTTGDEFDIDAEPVEQSCDDIKARVRLCRFNGCDHLARDPAPRAQFRQGHAARLATITDDRTHANPDLDPSKRSPSRHEPH